MIFLDFSLFSSVLLRFIFCIYFCWYFDDGLGWDGFSLSPSLTHHIFYFLTFDDIFFLFFSSSIFTDGLTEMKADPWAIRSQTDHYLSVSHHIILSAEPKQTRGIFAFLVLLLLCAAYAGGCTDSSSTKSSLALEPIVSLIFIFLFMFTYFVQSHNFLSIITFHIYLFLFLIFIIFPRDEMKRKTTVLLEIFRYTHLNYFGEKCRLDVF